MFLFEQSYIYVKKVSLIPYSYYQDELAQYKGNKGHGATSDEDEPSEP
jgi:hypothetical protein